MGFFQVMLGTTVSWGRKLIRSVAQQRETVEAERMGHDAESTCILL